MTAADYFKLAIIIFCTGIIGGSIAFLGNQLGRYIGRKKLSIFGLRPRYTSMLITIITGLLIASLTLTIAVVLSEPIRVSLTTHQKLQQDIDKLRDQLRQLIEDYRQKDIVYRYQDIIMSAVLEPEPDKDKMIEVLKALISSTNQAAIEKSKDLARKRGIDYKPPSRGRLVQYIPENLDEVADRLRRATEPQVIFVRANHNALLSGDEIITVELGMPIPNSLIYRKGELITSVKLKGTESRSVIGNQLYEIFSKIIPPIAISRGMLPDPETGKVGEIELDRLNDAVNKIKAFNSDVYVDFYARDDIHILGPLELDIKVSQAK